MADAFTTADLERKGWLLKITFLLIIAGFALSNLIMLFAARRIQAANEKIAKNALVSIADVSQVVHDIDHIRLLVDAHIFGLTPEERMPIESKMFELDTDLKTVARQYEPLATFSGEHAVWDSLWADILSLEGPLQKAVELSRNNRDAAARAEVIAIDQHFENVERDAKQLIEVNRDEADRSVAQIETQQRQSRIFLGAVTLAGTFLAIFAAAWVTRAVRQRDWQIAKAALLMEERNRELDSFAGRVAHDLRGPLSTISLATIRLGQEAPEHENTYAVLRRGVSRMEVLIADLLTLARLNAEIPESATDTKSLIKALQEQLLPAVKEVDGVLEMSLEQGVVRCPEGLLSQVLWNVGENAVKYRRSNVRLELDIQGKNTGSKYEFRISDNGAGMSSEEVRRAFEPFFRGEKARFTNGSGLGLSIVKRVLDVTGGTISIVSQVGVGTTFVIAFPLSAKAA
jgi:signal transduction histidine kinase